MSNFGSILNVIGQGMAGYGRGKAMYRDEQDRQDQADFDKKRRARMEAEWEREDATRKALSDAAAPQDVQTVAAPPNPDTVDPGTGETIRERPLPDTYSVGGQNFGADQSGASVAAQQANTPRAVALRQAMAVQGLDPMKAAQLRSQANSDRVQELQLDDAERKHLDTLFSQSLEKAGSHEELAQLMSDSGSGPSKFETVLSPDGKRVAYVRVMPDGSKQAIPGDFSNDAKGLEQAKMMLNDRVPASAKLAHLHQEAAEQHQQAQLDEQTRHNQVVEKNASDATLARLEAATLRAQMVGAGRAGARDDHFDAKQWDSAAKIDTSITGVTDDLGKTQQVPELRLAWQRAFNEAKTSGQYSPTEAQEQAANAVVLLRQLAEKEQAAAGKDKPLSYSDAVRIVLAKAQAAQRAPAQAAPGMGAAPRPAMAAPPAAAPAAPPALPSVADLAAQAPGYLTPEGKQLWAQQHLEAQVQEAAAVHAAADPQVIALREQAKELMQAGKSMQALEAKRRADALVQQLSQSLAKQQQAVRR